MLLGMRGSTILRMALRSGYHQDVLSYLMHCVYAGLLVSALSVFGFFFSSYRVLWDLWIVLVTFSVVLVLALMIRNEILMVRIVKHFMEDQRVDGE